MKRLVACGLAVVLWGGMGTVPSPASSPRILSLLHGLYTSKLVLVAEITSVTPDPGGGLVLVLRPSQVWPSQPRSERTAVLRAGEAERFDPAPGTMVLALLAEAEPKGHPLNDAYPGLTSLEGWDRGQVERFIDALWQGGQELTLADLADFLDAGDPEIPAGLLAGALESLTQLHRRSGQPDPDLEAAACNDPLVYARDVQEWALRLAAEMGLDTTVSCMVDALRTSGDPGLQLAGAASIGVLADPTGTEALRDHIRNVVKAAVPPGAPPSWRPLPWRDGGLVQAVALAAGHMGDDDLSPLLGDLVDSVNDTGIQATGIFSLVEIGGPKARRELRRIRWNHPSPLIRDLARTARERADAPREPVPAPPEPDPLPEAPQPPSPVIPSEGPPPTPRDSPPVSA